MAASSKPRSIWNGWLSWGTVNVPVKLYSAVQDKSIHFNQLHGKDGARIKQKRINPRTGDEVPYDRIVRGYEVSPDKWVVLSKEDAQAAEGSRAKVIDIEEFVADEQIDPVYYDKPYWIGPQEGGEHAYKVVEKALEKSGKVGIGRFVLRSKESLVALRPRDGILTLATMRFDEELVPPDKVNYEEAKKSPGDREAVLELVEKKAKGEEIEIPDREPEEETDDLMAALEASLSGSGKS